MPEVAAPWLRAGEAWCILMCLLRDTFLSALYEQWVQAYCLLALVVRGVKESVVAPVPIEDVKGAAAPDTVDAAEAEVATPFSDTLRFPRGLSSSSSLRLKNHPFSV